MEANSLTLSGKAEESGGSRNLTKVGAGALVLTSANTYSGTTTISGGALSIQNGAALGAASSGTTVESGASLEVQGGITSAEPLTLNGSGISSAGALRSLSGSNTMSGATTLGSDSSVGTDAGSLTLSGVIGGPDFGITKNGAGTLTLSGSAANTYTGATVVNTGLLQLNKSSGDAVAGNLIVGDESGSDTARLLAPNQIADGSQITVGSSGLLDLNGFEDTIGGLAVTGPGGVTTGAGTLTMAGDIVSNAASSSATITGKLSLGSADRTVTIADGTASNDLAISAVMSGTGGLVKAGEGTLLLSANNPYTGTSAIGEGTVLINGSQPSSAVVMKGGKLGGTGTTGAVSAETEGGIVGPGTSPGILNTGGVTFNSATTLEIELQGTTPGTGHDQLNVVGSVSLGDATISVLLGFTPSSGSTFVIAKNDGSDSIDGTFAGLAEGATFIVGGNEFRITYVGGDGNDVVLTAGEETPPPPPPSASGWEDLGGSLTSGPDAASWSANRLDVFVRGTDNRLWYRSWTGTTWTAWQTPGGAGFVSDPSAVSWGPGRIDVFARSESNRLIHKWFEGVWHPQL